MPTRTNPMKRLAAIFQLVLHTAPTNPAVAAWAKVFDTTTPDDPSGGPETLRCLAQLQREVCIADGVMRRSGVRPDVVNRMMQALRQASSIELAVAGFGHIQQLLQQDGVLHTLALAGDMHISEEWILEEHELDEIGAALALLGTAIANLPDEDPIRSFLSEQWALLRSALRDYQIAGASALRRAVYEFDGALAHQYGAPDDPSPGAPVTAEQATALHAAFSASRAVKVALATLGLVTALGTGVNAALKLAPVAASTQMYYLQIGSPGSRPDISSETADDR